MDMAREGLFNILSHKVDFSGLKVLDLFAGTGSISFEFASRGCYDVTAVEIDKKHVQLIKDFSLMLQCSSVRVVNADAFRFIKNAAVAYDVIFADPPFTFTNIHILPETILSSDILCESGIFILEHPQKLSFSNEHCYDVRKYGSVLFSFFCKKHKR